MGAIVLQGDVRTALRALPEKCVQCVVTSPPYFALRSYLSDDDPNKEKEIGLEPSPTKYLLQMVEVFREIRRVLRDDGTIWLNIGDSYSSSPPGNKTKGVSASSKLHGVNGPSERYRETLAAGHATKRDTSKMGKPKDLMLMPARTALALQADGWWIRQQLPWVKRSCMPESVKDRPANAVEYVYLIAKSARPFYDTEAVRRQAATKPGTRGAKASKERSEVAGVNSRPPEYHTYGDTRHFRNSDMFFDSLEKPYGMISDENAEPLALDVNTFAFPESHFASFPPKLVEPCILASTSERGRCSVCGSPYHRIVEKEFVPQPDVSVEKGVRLSSQHDESNRGPGTSRGSTRSKTIGWAPTCAHTDATPIPCLVLDPFGGSGTVGVVANRLGRDAILVELKPEYVEMAEHRIEDDEIKRSGK